MRIYGVSVMHVVRDLTHAVWILAVPLVLGRSAR